MYATLKELCGEKPQCDGNEFRPKVKYTPGLLRAETDNSKFLQPGNSTYSVPFTVIYANPKGYNKKEGDILPYPDGLRNVENAKLYLERKFPPYPDFKKDCPSCWSRSPPEDNSNYIGKYDDNLN